VNTQVKRFPYALAWIAGIAITLFCAAGIAAIMGWLPASMGYPGSGAPLTQANAPQPATAMPRPSPMVRTAPAPVASVPAARVRCADCGVVESTRVIAVSGEGTGLGAAGGAVVGGVVGHQIGGGRGQDVATVVGAVGGAVVGNEVEKRVRSTSHYEVIVRLDDGSSRAIRVADAPIWRAGDQVRIVDGVIRSN
jgi:outer membrane lipoprotein SlyB